MEEDEGYVSVIETSLIAKKMGYKLSPTTLQQNISRGVLRSRKILGVLHVNKENFDNYLLTKEKVGK